MSRGLNQAKEVKRVPNDRIDRTASKIHAKTTEFVQICKYLDIILVSKSLVNSVPTLILVLVLILLNFVRKLENYSRFCTGDSVQLFAEVFEAFPFYYHFLL